MKKTCFLTYATALDNTAVTHQACASEAIVVTHAPFPLHTISKSQEIDLLKRNEKKGKEKLKTFLPQGSFNYDSPVD